MIISLSGLDGSGKSTQIAAIARLLTEQGVAVRHSEVHGLSLYACVGRGLRRVSPNTAERLLTKQYALQGQGSERKRLLGLVRRLGLWCDLFLFMVAVYWPAKLAGASVTLCDRYIWDSAVQLRYLNLCGESFFEKFVSLVPGPDVAFFLDVEASEAHSRKPEFSLEHFVRKHEVYSELLRIRDDLVIIQSTTIAETQDEIVSSMKPFLSCW